MSGGIVPSSVENVSHRTRDCTLGSILIFSVGLLAFTIARPAEFIGLEARFAVFAQTMLREGPTFFPKTYLGPYPDYPAAPTFLIYLLARVFGRVTPLWAALPTGIASAMTLVGTYRIAAIHSRLWGVYGVLLAFLTDQFLVASRSISPDQYTSLVTVFCFYWYYSAIDRGASCPLWRFAVAFAVGFAFRGPIGLIIPAGVVCSIHTVQGEFRHLMRVGLCALVVLAACCGVLLVAAYHDGGEAFVLQVVKMQALGRLAGDGRSPLFYWINSFASYAVAYPLAVLVVAVGMTRVWDGTGDLSKRRLLRDLTIWAVVILVGLSIPGEKKSRYLLSAVPAFALLASYILFDASSTRVLSRTRAVLLRLCDWLPAVSVVGTVAAFTLRSRFTPPLDSNRLMIGGLVLAFGAIAWRLLRANGRVNATGWRVGIAAASFVVVQIGVVETILVNLEGTAAFVQQVEAEYSKDPGPIMFWQIGPDQEDMKFMANFSSSEPPGFISSLDDLTTSDGHAWFLANEENFLQLAPQVAGRFVVSARGRIGHEKCVAFRFAK